MGIAVVGVALAVLARSDNLIGAGIVLVGAALLVALLNFLFRMGVESNVDREREEQAHRSFDRTGRWPTR